MPTNKKTAPENLRRRPLGRYRYVRFRWRVLFTIIDALGSVMFAASRTVMRLLSLGCNERLQQPQRILISQLDHMGDAVISTVMLPLLRRRWPSASIEVLCGPWNCELFQAIDAVDRVHVSRLNRFLRGNENTLLKRFAWTAAVFAQGLRLRDRKFDLGIDVRGEFPNALMLWIAGAKRRLGWSCGGGGFLLTDVVAFVHNRPEVESRLALLAALGIAPESAEDSAPRFRPTAEARRSAAAKLDQLCRTSPSRQRSALVAVHVSAGTAAKRWPAEHWQNLIFMLRAAGTDVVLIGSGGDRAIVQAVLGKRPVEGVWDLSGQLDVIELAALIERADLFIGGDSGPAHLAAAVQTPAVVLFSGTNDSRQWRPCGPQVVVLRQPTPCGPCHRERCPLPAHPCMRKIDPAAVFNAAGNMIHLFDNEEAENDDRSAATDANKNRTRRSSLTQSS